MQCRLLSPYGRGHMGCSIRPVTLKLTTHQLLPFFTTKQCIHPHRQHNEGKVKPQQNWQTKKQLPIPFPNLKKKITGLLLALCMSPDCSQYTYSQLSCLPLPCSSSTASASSRFLSEMFPIFCQL